MYDFDTADTWILRIAFATQGLSTPSDFKTIIYLFFSHSPSVGIQQ